MHHLMSSNNIESMYGRHARFLWSELELVKGFLVEVK